MHKWRKSGQEYVHNLFVQIAIDPINATWLDVACSNRSIVIHESRAMFIRGNVGGAFASSIKSKLQSVTRLVNKIERIFEMEKRKKKIVGQNFRGICKIVYRIRGVKSGIFRSEEEEEDSKYDFKFPVESGEIYSAMLNG